MEWLTSSTVALKLLTARSHERCHADLPNIFFLQKVNGVLPNVLSIPLFAVILPWYSQWNITVYVCVIRMERKYAFLNKTWMQILFRMGFMFAAWGGLALMKVMCVVSCFTHCESQMTGIMFFQFNKVTQLTSGEMSQSTTLDPSSHEFNTSGQSESAPSTLKRRSLLNSTCN